MDVEQRNYLVLDKVIERYGAKPGGLIRVLYKAQELFGYLSPDLQTYVAEKMCLPVGHVHGVATFYSQFVTAPQGRHIISVCMGTACYVKNAQDVLSRFREVLGVATDETTADGEFTLRTTRCIGACSLAPLITVNKDVHGHLTLDDVARLVARYAPAAAEAGNEADDEARERAPAVAARRKKEEEQFGPVRARSGADQGTSPPPG